MKEKIQKLGNLTKAELIRRVHLAEAFEESNKAKLERINSFENQIRFLQKENESLRKEVGELEAQDPQHAETYQVAHKDIAGYQGYSEAAIKIYTHTDQPEDGEKRIATINIPHLVDSYRTHRSIARQSEEADTDFDAEALEALERAETRKQRERLFEIQDLLGVFFERAGGYGDEGYVGVKVELRNNYNG
tara:strand:+ start:45 stop:617 length:573 start_codon:yes stop_codon:yes gene_type:complete